MLVKSVDLDPGSDNPLELDSEAAALAIDRSGSTISEAFEETTLMPVLGKY